MPIPPEYSSLFEWWNSAISDLAENNGDLRTFQKYWGNLTAQQQTFIKNQMSSKIDNGVIELGLIKTHIQSL